jgi:hypothetical protein
MSNGRQFAGWVCVVLAFAVIVMLGYGVLDPIGMPAAGATSMGALLVGLLPSVGLALTVFAIGLWLLKGKR